MNKKTSLTPDKLGIIESALEERKTKRDRRSPAEPSGQLDPKADRRRGRDRRNKDD